MGGETKTTTDFKLPDWQENFLKGLSSYGSDLMSQPVTPYGGPMTAPLSALSGEAADIYRKMAEDPNVAGRTKEKFAAMKEAVLDPQVAAMARQFAQKEVGHQGDLIRAGAFGGSRRDIYEGERAGAYEADVASLMAQGYSSAEANALAEVGAERAGQGAAAAGLGGLSAAETDLALRNIAMPYQEFVRQQQMPLATFQGLTGLPTGYQLGGSSVERKPYDWFGALTGAGQAISMF